MKPMYVIWPLSFPLQYICIVAVSRIIMALKQILNSMSELVKGIIVNFGLECSHEVIRLHLPCSLSGRLPCCLQMLLVNSLYD